MIFTLRDEKNVYEIGRCIALLAGGGIQQFKNKPEASDLLGKLSADTENMTNLRKLLAREMGGSTVADFNDQNVLERIAQRLVSREFCLSIRQKHNVAPPTEGSAGQARQRPLPPRRQSSSAAPPVRRQYEEMPSPEESEFPPNLDAAAMTAVMRQAAQEGCPFFEE